MRAATIETVPSICRLQRRAVDHVRPCGDFGGMLQFMSDRDRQIVLEPATRFAKSYWQPEIDADVSNVRSTAGHHDAGPGRPWAVASSEVDDHVRGVDDADQSANDFRLAQPLG